MTFWVFQSGEPLAKVMPDGLYLIVAEESIGKVDVFDLEKSFSCSEADISIYSGPKIADMDNEKRGLWKMTTAANVLVLTGAKKGCSIRTNVIYQENKYGRKVYGILIGTLDTQPAEIRQQVISCVNDGIGYITKDMWYFYEKRGPASAKQVKMEGGEFRVTKKLPQGMSH